MLEIFKEKGYVIDWVDYYKSALDQGMQSDRILSRIDGDIVDVFGSEYRDEVLKRLRFFIQKNDIGTE